MGTYDNGAFGSFHGRVVNLVGSSWKGISYIKARPNTGTGTGTLIINNTYYFKSPARASLYLTPYDHLNQIINT